MASIKKAEIEVDIRELVKTELQEQERDYAWLSRKTGIPYATLYYCLKLKLFVINEQNLKKINTALGSNFKNNL